MEQPNPIKVEDPMAIDDPTHQSSTPVDRTFLSPITKPESCFVLVEAIPANLDAWAVLDAEARLSEGLVSWAIRSCPNSSDGHRSVTIEYSPAAFAEAFLYRSAEKLHRSHGLKLSLSKASPSTVNVSKAVNGSELKRAVEIREPITPTPSSNYNNLSSRLPLDATEQHEDVAADYSSDDCMIISSRPVGLTNDSATKVPTASITTNDAHTSTPQNAANIAGPQDQAPFPAVSAMTKTQQIILLKGIQQISKTSNAVYFAQPIDRRQMELLQVPHYFDKIKKPMDLRTMEGKLKNAEYSTVNEYASDFSQMIKNSIVFNGRDHEVTAYGMSLKRRLDKQIAALPKGDSVEKSGAASKMNPNGQPRKWRTLESEITRPSLRKRRRLDSETSEENDNDEAEVEYSHEHDAGAAPPNNSSPRAREPRFANQFSRRMM
ncbi:hypothetical protein MMC13_001967 [Lambiella insularis]|nr:hypothetical protein [Lambiella insularis]